MEKTEKPVLLEIEFSHECWCIDAAERSESTVRMLYHGSPRNGSVSGLLEVVADDIQKLVKALKREKDVVEVKIISKLGNTAMVYIRHKQNTLIAEAVESVNCVPLYPSLTRGGRDVLVILAPTEKALPQLKSLLKEQCSYYNLHFKKYVDKPLKGNYADYLKLSTIASQLSPRQVELFSLACRKGFYENPKSITLQELADQTGIAKSTLAEHLRKVESKIMPVLGEITRF